MGKDRMYALRGEQGSLTHDTNDIINVTERFYTKLYASDVGPREPTEPKTLASDVPVVTKGDVEKALKGMKEERLQVTTQKPCIL